MAKREVEPVGSRQKSSSSSLGGIELRLGGYTLRVGSMRKGARGPRQSGHSVAFSPDGRLPAWAAATLGITALGSRPSLPWWQIIIVSGTL